MKTKIKETVTLYISNSSLHADREYSDLCTKIIKRIEIDATHLTSQQFQELVKDGGINVKIKRDLNLIEIMKENDLSEEKVIELIKKHY